MEIEKGRDGARRLRRSSQNILEGVCILETRFQEDNEVLLLCKKTVTRCLRWTIGWKSREITSDLDKGSFSRGCGQKPSWNIFKRKWEERN